MISRSKKISFQFIDVFSEASSSSCLSIENFNNENLEQGTDLHKSSEAYKISVSDENPYDFMSLEDETKIIMEPNINSKLKFNEKHIDLEILKPDGIGATKFNTSILIKKKEKEIFRKNTQLEIEGASSYGDMTKHSSNINKSSRQTLTSNSKKVSFNRTSKADSLMSTTHKSKFISTPHVANQHSNYVYLPSSIAFNAAPQYYSSDNSYILNRPFPQPCYPVSNLINLSSSYVPIQSYNNNLLYQPNIMNTNNFTLYPLGIKQPNYPLKYASSSLCDNASVASKKKHAQTSPISTKNINCDNTDYLINYLNSLSQSKDLIDYLCSQAGCKEVQRKLHKMNGEAANHLIKLILNLEGLERIMKDPFANYIFQNCAELASPHIRMLIINYIEPIFIILGCDVFGSHCLQKLVIVMDTDTERTALVDLISNTATTICFDSYGVYIVLKALETIALRKRSKLNNIILHMLGELVKDVQGVCVVSSPYL